MSALPPHSTKPPFWPVVWRLLAAARRRSRARARHRQKLLNQRRGKTGDRGGWGGFGLVLAVLLGFIVNGVFAGVFWAFNDAARQAAAATGGRFAIESDYLLHGLQELDSGHAWLREAKARLEGLKLRNPPPAGEIKKLAGDISSYRAKLRSSEELYLHSIATEKALQMGGVRSDWDTKVQAQYATRGSEGFVKVQRPKFALARGAVVPLAELAGLFVVAWWFVMLAFQGEGLELDFQRRRHPMWEWLLAHPVQPASVFMAEMLSPLAANVIFLGAPGFWIGLHFVVHGSFWPAVLTGTLAGVPMGLAACCASKALEIAVMLRLSPRSRGAVLGIMSWLGYSALMLGMLVFNARAFVAAAMGWVEPYTHGFTWPVFGWLMGYGMGAPSALKGVAVCWAFSAVVIFLAARFSARATNQGLAGGFGSVVSAPKALSARSTRHWLRDPLHRKELLWFWRDRGALVQVFLIPMTVAAQQAFNLRGLASAASHSWHTLAGVAVIFGTYFLFILGPRSLISEGQALWLPLTWPRGMEALLKAKARLWWFIATGVVSLILLVDACMFPAQAWRVALVGVGWFLFSGSLAEKTVTLVSAPGSSGEPEPVPRGRRWAAMLGTFTFAAGVLSQRWSLAFTGVVYSWLTSAAMWQNFRARLPYLFDPWSEKVPPPPTLMHAMIAISAMTEGMAVLLALLVGFFGKPDNLAAAQAIAYGSVGLLTVLILSSWLNTNHIPWRQVLQWPAEPNKNEPSHNLPGKLGMGALAGTALAVVALGYVWLLHQFPALRDYLEQHNPHLAESVNGREWLILLAVICAPLAEELLFRGLLYRALDREWGGWRAMGASALFFAIYHPPIAWVPVAALGFLNAWLFRRTGHLAPCVIAHMAYNAVVVYWT